VLAENRNGLVAQAQVRMASGSSERGAALEMLVKARTRSQRVSVGVDKGYAVQAFVADMRDLTVTPHPAQKEPKPAERHRCESDAAVGLRDESKETQVGERRL